MKDAALEYIDMDLAIIPMDPKNKHPLLMTWKEFQTKKPTRDQVKKWWSTWPNAMIGMITGKINQVCLIDIDSSEAGKWLKETCPEVGDPHAKTPRPGWHYYFRCMDGVGCSNPHKNVDVKGEGGIAIIPPSKRNGNKAYRFIADDFDFRDIPQLPSSLYAIISSSSYSSNYSRNCNNHANNTTQHQGNTSATIATFSEGTRDNDLFHLANCLVKGGMPDENIRKYLHFFASNCNPPFSPTEAELKIKSALNRENKRSKNLTADIREYIAQQNGNINVTSVYHDVTSATLKEKAKVRAILSRLVKEGLIEPVGKNAGVYRKIEDNLEWMDIESADTTPFPIKWPTQVEKMIHLPKAGVVLVAGQVGAGKTTYLLNLAKMNMNRGKDVIFISTETNAQGMKIRLEGFGAEGISISDLTKSIKFAFLKEGEIADAIDRNKLQDSILIVDYLEVENEFWKVGSKLSSIFRRMKNGVAFVGLQMKGDQLLGGNFGLHRPEVVLTLKKDRETRYTKATIEKCRWIANPGDNPIYKSCMLNLTHGCIVHQLSDWERGKNGR